MQNAIIRGTFFLLTAWLPRFQVWAEVSSDSQIMAKNWAPLIWLHPDEIYFPSNIAFYLKHMEVRNEVEEVVQSDPSPESILRGDPSQFYHLNTFDDLECVRCTRPHFHGQPLTEVIVHALVKEHKDGCNTVDVSYPFFYPYNYGKDVCLGADPGGLCLGAKPTFGNHVSDWEHCLIRFQNGLPVKIYLAIHGFGALYKYDSRANEFIFEQGEGLEAGDVTFPILYPEKVFMVNQTHPELFSANGSHGTWPAPGKHTFLNFIIHMEDYCDRGFNWNTWENMEFLDATLPDSAFSGNLSWIDFRGRWGNIRKLKCELEPILGNCGLSPGVHGPGTNWGFSGLGDIPLCF